MKKLRLYQKDNNKTLKFLYDPDQVKYIEQTEARKVKIKFKDGEEKKLELEPESINSLFNSASEASAPHERSEYL